MSRPPKPISLVQGHRTKAEKAIRTKAESELLTGTPLKEWPEVKSNPAAHKEFTRIKKLLKAINHDDDLYSLSINTLCRLKAEEEQLLKVKEQFIYTLNELEDMEMRIKVQNQILGCDRSIMQKRKLILDISKENIMTIQSALRSVPKKEKPKNGSPMAEFLKRKQGGVNGA